MLLIYYAQQLHSNWWLLGKFYLDSSLTYLSALSMIYKHHFISNPTSQLPAAVFIVDLTTYILYYYYISKYKYYWESWITDV